MSIKTRNYLFTNDEPDDVVIHKGQRFAGLERRWDSDLGSYRYGSRRAGKSSKDSLFVPLLHGMGPVSSSAGSMLSLLNVLTESKKKKSKSKTLKLLRTLEHYNLYECEAMDLPGCHGLPPSSVQDLSGMCRWVLRWFFTAKAHKVAIVPIARCASAAIVLDLVRRYRKLFAGLVFVSPMLPSDSDHSNTDLLNRVRNGECELNETAFSLMNLMNAQSKWDELPDPFFQVPTLILSGSFDQQTSILASNQIRHWSDTLPHVEVREFPTGHDVMDLKQGAPSVAAYRRLYDFLHRCSPHSNR